MIKIRPAKFKELETIREFQALMAQETEGITLDREVLFQGVEAVFEDPAKGTYYVALNEDEKVVACLMTTPEFSEWRNGTVIWIQSVYVTKEYRKQGVFKQMYNYLKHMVNNDPDLMGIRLYVEIHNMPAQRAYINLGMTSEHYKMYEWMQDF